LNKKYEEAIYLAGQVWNCINLENKACFIYSKTNKPQLLLDPNLRLYNESK
jgi:hypothetical protein